MKNDEFAFLNQQLASMLRDGIPLEGALQRLCGEMEHGPLRSELELLQADLAKGTPLREAVRARQLPELYQQMLEIGVQSNDLPGVLTLLADHYQRSYVTWTRLKGLMVYPLIVLTSAFLLSCFLCFMFNGLIHGMIGPHGDGWVMLPASVWIGVWAPPVLLGLLVAGAFLAVTTTAMRRALRWRVPAFKEASLAQVASAMALMLKSGVSLDKALALMVKLEAGTPAEAELAGWRKKLADGQGRFAEMATGGRSFPPLFVWLVSQSGENLSAGFERAADVYNSRANYHGDVMLYSALPCSILALGIVIIAQMQPTISVLVAFMNSLGSIE
jgi:type IV pilus assembly protein PilC